MDCTHVGVFEKTDKVRLSRFLQGANRKRGKPDLGSKLLRNFFHQALEWQFPDQKIGWLLIFSNFTQRYCTGTVSMRFFNATCFGGRFFTRSFGCKSPRGKRYGLYMLAWGEDGRLKCRREKEKEMRIKCGTYTFRGALPPVDFLAVCFVRAINVDIKLYMNWNNIEYWNELVLVCILGIFV